ncbi:NADPH-dependent diflavin oxidoreductase 1 [Babesia sp. Xinjiang]|uniref:NADPH-dependent diflavin oxidoreductase 1 n=1 Tax=Babesia sp. Xinjiang TaxID=462227 RepID=UPI000A23CD4E|nr:NADPH-dependent diflavin oxidoreductase 1 [Babesia sp. Xinjiang]ORM39348.1 NADPH-dependent diflavin oxidoreductase 1 [Babesia sp. Xinjiang]
MGALSFLDRIKSVFTGNAQKVPEEFKDLHKYERLLGEERKAKEEHIEYNLTAEANRALRFATAYGECYDQCAGLALREELKAASLESLLPSNITSVPSKDALTFKKNPGEAAVAELVGEILGEDMTEGPKPTAEHLVKQQLNDDIKRNIRLHELQCELHQLGLDITVRSAARVTTKILASYDRCIFIVSTAAYGEFPHAIQPLAVELKTQKTGSVVRYTVFGLGDSRYPLFNYSARKLVALLESAGASCFYAVAYGDDQHPLGHLGEFITWISGLTELFSTEELGNPPSLCFELTMKRLGNEGADDLIDIRATKGTVLANELITSDDHFRPVRNLLIDCNGQNYDVGDVCCLYPTGDPGAVKLALQSLGYDPQEVIVISREENGRLEFNRDLELLTNVISCTEKQEQLPFEGKAIKLQTLFVEFLSLDNICTQWQMYVMAAFADVEIHRDKLLEMASFTVDGCAEYNRYCKDEHRSLLEVLRDFNSVSLPLQVLVNIATPYYPRMYSIASIPTTIGISRYWTSMHDLATNELSYGAFKGFLMRKRSKTGIMELCVANVTHNTPYKREVQGQASELLKNAAPGSLIRFRIFKSELPKMLLEVNTPVLFICTGTGIAACKPLLEARVEMLTQMWNQNFRRPKVRDLALIGFRRRKQDHLYLGDLRLLNLWCDVHVVYSRETGRKVYVQDAIGKYANHVLDIMVKGMIVISGRSHPMPKQVTQRLRDLLVEHAGFGNRAADKFMESAVLGGKIIFDTWG